MKTCPMCQEEKRLTKHHIVPKRFGIDYDEPRASIKICRDCHDETHNMEPPKVTVSILKRRIHRAEKRIVRDQAIIEDSTKQLREIEK